MLCLQTANNTFQKAQLLLFAATGTGTYTKFMINGGGLYLNSSTSPQINSYMVET